MFVNNTIFLLLFVAIVFMVIWSLKRNHCTKLLISLGASVESAISSFDALNRLDRDFTKDELDAWISLYKPLFEDTTSLDPKDLSSKYDNLKKAIYEFQERFRNAPEIQVENELNRYAINFVNSKLDNFIDYQNSIISDRIYYSHNLMCQYEAKCVEFVRYLNSLNKKGLLGYLKNRDKAFAFLHNDEFLLKPEEIKSHNENYINIFKEEYKSFFDTCLKYPLDEQQREAVLHDEDNNLIISSAGSGKTLTMVAKTMFLVQKRKVSPKDILLITYTRKAAGELASRLDIEGVTCITFHSLAQRIISEETSHKPSLCEGGLLFNCFYGLLETDDDFISAVNEYILENQTLMKLEHDYVTAEEYYRDRRKYGIMADYKDRNGETIFTKSEEERRICNWLSLHGVSFLYEAPYELSTSTVQYRQYTPDFTIFYLDSDQVEHRIYLEHFAINHKGCVPLWFGNDYNAADQSETAIANRWKVANKRYIDGIEWKRNLHKEKNTILIETTSAMFHDHTVWEHLETCLKEHGVLIKELSPKEIYQTIVSRNRNIEHSVLNLISQFCNLQKSNMVNMDELIKKASDENDERSSFILEKIMKPMVDIYALRLKERNLIDYTDMILQASDLCKTYGGEHFKYILVDEFQDISRDRYMFLQNLRRNDDECFTKLFCVGDDWQSIYRFAGSDMSLFYDFQKYFGFTKLIKMETTYRFHEPLINVSSKFIQKNPSQVVKKISEFKTPKQIELENQLADIKQEIIDIKDKGEDLDETLSKQQSSLLHSLDFYKTKIDFIPYIGDDTLLRRIQTYISGIPIDEDIMIIGRYNHNCNSLGYVYSDEDSRRKSVDLTIGERKVKYMSVHSSKGLEADHVFLINCNGGPKGFPSLIEDDPVLAFVLSDKDTFENAEERRVFYVAITRAKKKMYVLYDDKNPSSFIHEFVEQPPVADTLPCPQCGCGDIKINKSWTDRYGHDYVSLICSNRVCDFYERKLLEDYLKEVDSFKERDTVASVQEHAKSMAADIKNILIRDVRRQKQRTRR